MPSSFTRLSFGALLVLSGSLGAQDEAAYLVPPEATVLLRFESIAALVDLAQAFAPIGGDAAPSLDAATMLGALNCPGDPGAVDTGRPFYLALSIGTASPSPARTWVVPTTDAAAFQKPITVGTGTTVATLGGYAGVSTLASYAPGATPSPLAAHLRPGIAALHLDLATLIQTFRPFIDMGLQQAEAAMDTVPMDDMPFDIQPMLELYLEGARNVVDSAEALDLALGRQGDQVAFQLDFRARTGSKLDGFASGTVTDPSRLAGAIDPASSIQMLFNGNWRDYVKPFEDLIDAVLEVYPEPLRADLRKVMDAQIQLGAKLQPGVAGGFDFGSAGMHGSYVMRSDQPAEFLAGLEALLSELDHEGSLFHLGPVQPLTVGGLEARVHPFTFDYPALRALMESQFAGAGAVDPAALEQFQQALGTIYGNNLRLALASQGDLVLMCFGNDDAVLQNDLARLRAPATPSPKLLNLMERIEPGAVGFAYHLDFGQTMSQMLEAMRSLVPTPGLTLPRSGASFDFWGSIHGRTWSGGWMMSVQELIAFAQSMQALEKH